MFTIGVGLLYILLLETKGALLWAVNYFTLGFVQIAISGIKLSNDFG